MDAMDAGDKISAHISFKRGLPNYSSVEFGASVTLTKRAGETDEEAWQRAWSIVEQEVDNAVERAESVINQK